MKFVKAMLVFVALLAIAVAPAGVSAKGKYETDVTIKGPNGDFSGKVKSSNPECESGRKVNVFKKKAGNDKKIGSDTTEGDGKWSTGNSGENKGKFYAESPAAFGICEKGKSETIELD